MPDRSAIVLVALGIAIFGLSVTFPLWMLTAYPVTAEPVETAEANHRAVPFDELGSENQDLVERAIAQDDPVTVYGPYRSHRTSDGELPSMLEDSTVDDYTVGVVVSYEGETYAVGAPLRGPPWPLPYVLLGPAVGMGLVAIGGLAWVREYRGAEDRVLLAALSVGAIGLLVLLWMGNVHGYLRPIW